MLFSALAWADVLLTLDRNDFTTLLGDEFYGLPVLKPGTFLERERAAGVLRFNEPPCDLEPDQKSLSPLGVSPLSSCRWRTAFGAGLPTPPLRWTAGTCAELNQRLAELRSR